MTKRPGKGKFDIDDGVPGSGEADAAETAGTRARLGPMASAIRQTRDAQRAAVPSADLEMITLELAAQMKDLRDSKLDLRRIPTDAIDDGYLERDRGDLAREALDELKASIRAHGLSVPIRVDLLDDGRFGLNQGLRRLVAFRELHAETGDEAYALVPALVDRETERQGAYRRMVDENLVREDVSHAEMAMLAMAYAAESGCTDESAVDQLYESISRQRRYQVSAFVRVVRAIGDLIRFPREIPRDLGLAIAGKAKDRSGLDQIRHALISADASTPEAEREALERGVRAKPVPRAQARSPKAETFRMLVGPDKTRRVDVTVTGKRMTISGFKAEEWDLDRLRAFIEETGSR